MITNFDDSQRSVYIQEIVHQIRRLMQASKVYTKELDKKYSVSAPQLACLSTLYFKGPLPSSMIARSILVNSSTVTGIIDRLEKKGLVRRVRNSRDRRVINIELTEAGEDLAKKAPPPVQQKIVMGLETLPLSRIKEIVDGLQSLTTLLDIDDFPVEENGETPL